MPAVAPLRSRLPIGTGLFARLSLATLTLAVLPLVGLGLYLIDRNADELRTSPCALPAPLDRGRRSGYIDQSPCPTTNSSS